MGDRKNKKFDNMDSPDGKSSPAGQGSAAYKFFEDGFSQSQSQRPVNGFNFQGLGNTQSQSQRVDMFTQGDLTQPRGDFTQGDFTQPDDEFTGGAGLEFCSQPEDEDDNRRRRHTSSSSSAVRKTY